MLTLPKLYVDGVPATPFLRRLEWAFRHVESAAFCVTLVLVPQARVVLGTVPFFAVVISVFTTMDSLGRTIESGVMSLIGGLLAACVTMFIYKVLGSSLAVTLGALPITSFLIAYPNAHTLAKRIAQAINVVSLLGFYTIPGLDVLFPLRLTGAAAFGCLCSVLALLLPFPRLAHTEVKARAAFLARAGAALYSSLLESYLSESEELGAYMRVQAEALHRAAADNVAAIEALRPDLWWEPTWHGSKGQKALDSFLKLMRQLAYFTGGMQTALNDPYIQHAVHSPLKSRMKEVLRKMSRCTALALVQSSSAFTGKAVAPATLQQDSHLVLQEFLKDLRKAREAAYYQSYRDPKVPTVPTVPASAYFLFNAEKYAEAVFVHAGLQVVELFAGESEQERSARESLSLHHDTVLDIDGPHEDLTRESQSRRATKHLGNISKRVLSLLSMYKWNEGQAKEAVRRAIAITGAAAAGLYTTNLAQRGIWSAVAAAFVGEARVGGTLTKSMQRVTGTVLGAIVGYAMIVAVRAEPVGVGILLSLWIGLAGFARGNPRTGYAAIVAGFTAAIIMLGYTPSYLVSIEDFAFTRLEQTILGVACTVLADLLIWPVTARKLACLKLAQTLCQLKAYFGWELSAHLEHRSVRARGEAEEKIKQLGDPIRAGLKLQQVLAKEAAAEPDLWRGPFPLNPYLAIVQSEEQVLKVLITLRYTLQIRSNAALDVQADRLINPLRGSLILLGEVIIATFDNLLDTFEGAAKGPKRRFTSFLTITRDKGTGTPKVSKASQRSGSKKPQSLELGLQTSTRETENGRFENDKAEYEGHVSRSEGVSGHCSNTEGVNGHVSNDEVRAGANGHVSRTQDEGSSGDKTRSTESLQPGSSAELASNVELGLVQRLARGSLHARRRRVLKQLEERYQRIIAELVEEKQRNPESPLLDSVAVLHFNALVYALRVTVLEADRLEQSAREYKMEKCPIDLRILQQLPPNIVGKPDESQQPLLSLLGDGPGPPADEVISPEQSYVNLSESGGGSQAVAQGCRPNELHL